MSWECKYLNETFCEKRKQECDPGAKGCVLQGRFSFPLKEKTKTSKKENLDVDNKMFIKSNIAPKST